jgi:hypothetical protein
LITKGFRRFDFYEHPVKTRRQAPIPQKLFVKCSSDFQALQQSKGRGITLRPRSFALLWVQAP